jgi:hypothetical protein
MMDAPVDALERKFNEPLLILTYFVVVAGVELVLTPTAGFVADKKLELTYPSFPFAFTFDQPFASE